MEAIRIRSSRIIQLWMYFGDTSSKVESIYCWLYIVMRRENSVMPPCFDLIAGEYGFAIY